MKACPFCAEMIQDSALKCRYCREYLDGRPRPAPAPVRSADPVSTAGPGMRMLMPSSGISALAVAAGYFGLLSVLVFPAPIALVLGILAVNDIKKNGRYGMGRALFGLIAGAIGTVFLALAMLGAVLP